MRYWIWLVIPILFGCRNQPDSQIEQIPPKHPGLYKSSLIATGMNERDITFSPDGSKIVFSVWSGNAGTLLKTEKTDRGWTTPEVVPFSGIYSDVEPFITPDGNHLFFASNRPLNIDGASKDYDIWRSDRVNGAWSAPVNLGAPVNSEEDEFYPTVSSSGTLCLTGKREGQRDEDIFLCKKSKNGYLAPERLSDSVNSRGAEFNALIAPDESFLIFSGWGRKDGMGGGDLYISFRSENGGWKPAINMGTAVNSQALDYCPALHPDGKAFFFTSRRTPADITQNAERTYENLLHWHQNPQNGNSDIYWMHASVIDSLQGG